MKIWIVFETVSALFGENIHDEFVCCFFDEESADRYCSLFPERHLYVEDVKVLENVPNELYES